MPSYFSPSNDSFIESNCFANKSSLIIDWILKFGIKKENFSVREVSRATEVSLGLVQKVFHTLVMTGHLKAEGIRTAKKFSIKNPHLLLRSWTQYYSIVKKCRLSTYRSSFLGRNNMLELLKKDKVASNLSVALHAATEFYQCSNTNLDTLELYLNSPSARKEVEELLELEPQERGYEVLLIEPYYKSLLKQANQAKWDGIAVAPKLLTFLDLYHFPLRGREQAEYMAEKTPSIKRIYKTRE